MTAARVLLLSSFVACSLGVLHLPSSATAEEIPLADVPMDFYSLKNWGVKEYDLYHFRKKEFKTAGVAITERLVYPVARTPIETLVVNDKIILREYWRDQESKFSRTLVTCHCNMDNLLSLEKMTVRYQDKVFTCDVTDGDYELTFLRKTRAGEWPSDTVIDAALLRVVTLLPRKEGTVYTFGHWSRTPLLNVQPVQRSPIRCEGRETITIAGRPMDCTKYVAGNVHTWVRNEDDVLARIEIPGWKILEIAEGDTKFALEQ